MVSAHLKNGLVWDNVLFLCQLGFPRRCNLHFDVNLPYRHKDLPREQLLDQNNFQTEGGVSDKRQHVLF